MVCNTFECYQTNIKQTINTFAKGGGWVMQCKMKREKGEKIQNTYLLCIAASNQMSLPGYRHDMLTARLQSNGPIVIHCRGLMDGRANLWTIWQVAYETQGIPHPVMRRRWSHQVAERKAEIRIRSHHICSQMYVCVCERERVCACLCLQMCHGFHSMWACTWVHTLLYVPPVVRERSDWTHLTVACQSPMNMSLKMKQGLFELDVQMRQQLIGHATHTRTQHWQFFFAETCPYIKVLVRS